MSSFYSTLSFGENSSNGIVGLKQALMEVIR
jgi:hypothetical protein